MMDYLGASLDPNNLKPFFYSLHGSKIYVLLDACHMLKLVRNQFASEKNTYDENDKEISWFFITQLNRIQEIEEFKLGNRISNRL